jgi:hypothetical protein
MRFRGRQRFGAMHGVSLRTGSPIVRTSPDLWKPAQTGCGEIRSCPYGGPFSRVPEELRTKA